MSGEIFIDISKYGKSNKAGMGSEKPMLLAADCRRIKEVIMAKKVVVVRVGTETIRIVHMDNTPDNPTVYGCVRVPTPQGAVEDGEVKNIMDVSRRIKQACQEKGITTKDVIFSLSSSKIANRETTIPLVKDSKIQGIVDAKVGDLFPMDKDRYIFSYVKQGGSRTAEEGEKVTDGSEKAKEQEKEEEPEITDDTKKKKKKHELKLNFNIGKKKNAEEGEEPPQDVLDLLVYAAPIDLVRSYYALAEGCDFNVMAIEVDGNGIFQIMKRQVNEGVEMAVQINRDATLINIMSKDKLLLQRTIPYGASTIVEAVMNEPAFQAPEYDKAFKIITTQRVLLYNLNASNPQNDLSMQKRIELTQSASSLIGNIYRVIEYYNSRYREEPVSGIIVTGDGAKIAGIHELMANELGIPTRTPSELQGVQFNRQIEVNVNILQYVGCFGAVYSPVNFIPEDIKNKTATRESIKGIAAVFAASIIVCIVMVAFSMIVAGTAKSSYEQSAQKERALQPVQAQYDNLQNDMKRILTYMKMEGITDTNNNKLHAILEQVKETCPKDFTISAVNVTNKGGTISCVSTDKKLSSVSALVIRLNLITNIKNVKISSSIIKDEDGVTKKQQYKYTISFDYLSFRESRDSNEIDFFGDELTLGDEEAK